MTTIAYCAGQMACDSCWNWNSTQTTSMTKIQRLSSGALFGGAGDSDDRAIIALLDKIKLAAKMPTAADLAATRCDINAVFVLPRGGVYIVSCESLDVNEINFKGTIWPANRGYAACGTGADLAIGAMAAGKSAREAVAIACKWDINSRPPVHVLRL